MIDPTESTAAAAEESVQRSTTDTRSDDMGSEGGPELADQVKRREFAEEEVAAKLGDVA